MGLQIGYHLLNLTVFFLLCVIGFKAINGAFGSTPKSKRKKTQLIAGLILWQIYILGLGQTELLSSFELPPRFVIFLVAPAFLYRNIYLHEPQQYLAQPYS